VTAGRRVGFRLALALVAALAALIALGVEPAWVSF
jgi:hypothetical protein